MMKIFLNLKAFLISLNSKLSSDIGKFLLRNTLKISTAESCTGGLISSRLTDIPGSSAYIHMNFVTYSNESKSRILNVSPQTIEKYGAVSAECAKEMALGLMQLTKSDVILCTTGVAGPSASEQKPVGLMYVACAYNGNINIKEIRLNPNYNRKNMKFLFSEEALKFALDIIKN